MIRNKKFALLAAAACAFWAAAIPVRAQVTTAPTIKATPVHTQTVKPLKIRFEVLHMMVTGIQVRSLVNEREIHTFLYADSIRDRMQKLLDTGGYQYGDKIVIQYEPGSNVALRIKGKPSKPV